MNVFVLAEDMVVSVQQHANIHLHKMILESAQMLSTSHRMLDGHQVPGKRQKYVLDDPADDALLYKSTHIDHPWTEWTCESTSNYFWHYAFFIHLCAEYSFRRRRIHLTQKKLAQRLAIPPVNLPSGPRTNFPLAVKDHSIVPDDIIQTYRNHYMDKALRMKMRFEPRPIPEWFTYPKGSL